MVPRDQLVEEAVTKLRDARCLLVHSRIGNGKTVFLHILAHKLMREGYRCFLSLDGKQLRPSDLDVLKSIQKPVIMFDSYNEAIDMIDQLSTSTDSARFVVAIRTSVQEVRLHEIADRLPVPLERVDLNVLQKVDASDFRYLLDKSGLGSSGLAHVMRKSTDFRDIVVTLYNHTQIKEKIKREFSPLLDDREFRRVFIVSHLLHWIGQRSDVAFVRSITHCDPYVAVAKFREKTGDLFSLDDGQLNVRSSIFSEYLIQNHLGTMDILDCVYDIVVEAILRRSERRYQAILSNVMRVSVLNRALRRDPGRRAPIRRLFERLRRDVEMNKWPLFWLQYSILMTDEDELDVAESFIRTAYSRADAIGGFHTFQIDTYAAKLFLLIEQRSMEPTVRRFDAIVERLSRVRAMIGEESRRFHAIQVLQQVEPFVLKRIAVLSNGERIALVQHLHLLMQAISNLSTHERRMTNADDIKDSLERSVRLIVSWDVNSKR